PEILERLAGAFAEAVTRSRNELKPARMNFARAAIAGTVANRIDESFPANDRAACLMLTGANGRILGGMVSFSAHPTCFGRENRKASGDYPGVVERGMEDKFSGVWLFACGSCGSMKIVSARPRGPKRVADVGGRVLAASAAIVQSAMADESSAAAQPWRPSIIPIESAVLEVYLPPLQVRISRNWRLSPVISSLVHGRRTYVQVLVIGRLVLLGMPCDYSGELANRLESAKVGPVESLVTSFNGDYIGYLIPHGRYHLKHYESRDANLFGPWCGEYFDELSRRILQRAGGLYMQKH
ncbi:MAG: hypothetical protein J7M14_07620, partial [Planctomycetes bacterium]|nr:hypothetical protein [Planctomycetota bacterium]